MDYSPISAGRVFTAFALTLIVGVAPLLAILLNRNQITIGDGYGGLVLGLGSIVVALTLMSLSWLAVVLGRRVVGRPSRV